MKTGYVRISTKEQNTARQDELMKRLGVDKDAARRPFFRKLPQSALAKRGQL